MPALRSPRPRKTAQHGTFPGGWGPMLPSRSHGRAADGMVFGGGGSPTNWTPHGLFAPGSRVWRSMPYSHEEGPSLAVERTPGAWWTPPALWNLAGIADGFLPPGLQQRLGLSKAKTASPYLPTTSGAVVANPFPSTAPPTPTYPLPAAWPGQL